MHLHTCDILWSTAVIILSDVHIVHLWLVGTSSNLLQSIGWVKTSYHNIIFWGSVQFGCSVMSDSLQPHESQHARPPCPLPTPGVYPNACPLSRWCHPTISSSVIPFSFCPQSFPAPGSFQMSQLFGSGGPEYWSFSFNISPSNEHPGLISLRMDWYTVQNKKLLF